LIIVRKRAFERFLYSMLWIASKGALAVSDPLLSIFDGRAEILIR